uniref:Galectin n=1 Tax=Pygocentrus nattereri TaxID=42514 RepID=A0AAR2KZD9_PYGNA
PSYLPCIPYVGTIPGGLRPGMALYFQGVVNPDANEFFINHKLGTKDGDDVAFHFNPRVNKSMVRDSFRNGKWEGPEETQWCPFVRGSAFDIFIVAYVNGQRNCFFKHRMPVEKVTTLHIKGDVFMNTIGYVAVSHLLHDKWIKSDWLCNAAVNGLFLLTLTTNHINEAKSHFTINLKTGQRSVDDIAFHFNPRVGTPSVVRNTFRNGQWQNGPEETQWCPFVRGSAFDIFIVTILFSFQAYVNGQRNCFFKHRMPVEKVTTLHIKGDVFMNTIGYVAVSHLLHDKWIKSDWLCNAAVNGLFLLTLTTNHINVAKSHFCLY